MNSSRRSNNHVNTVTLKQQFAVYMQSVIPARRGERPIVSLDRPRKHGVPESNIVVWLVYGKSDANRIPLFISVLIKKFGLVQEFGKPIKGYFPF